MFRYLHCVGRCQGQLCHWLNTSSIEKKNWTLLSYRLAFSIKTSVTLFSDMVVFGPFIPSQRGKRRLMVTHPIIHSWGIGTTGVLPRYTQYFKISFAKLAKASSHPYARKKRTPLVHVSAGWCLRVYVRLPVHYSSLQQTRGQ